MVDKQKIVVFQQNDSGVKKVAGIWKYGNGCFDIELVSIDDSLPPVIDDAGPFLPGSLTADIVLDYLKHPDLSYDLAARCRSWKIPVVASGKKIHEEGVSCPPTCCGLSRMDRLGLYGERFGIPELEIALEGEIIRRIDVVRGAPCGATWEAVEKITGLAVDDAVIRIGLETQFFCVADPAGWDPIYGKSPVHFAGNIHSMAMKNAVRKKFLSK